MTGVFDSFMGTMGLLREGWLGGLGASRARVSPLDVMLTVMERKWQDGDWDGAVQLAKAAAPYVHPRAAMRPASEPAGMSDAELDEHEGGEGTEGTDPG